jgi:hypothetical protein
MEVGQRGALDAEQISSIAIKELGLWSAQVVDRRSFLGPMAQ